MSEFTVPLGVAEDARSEMVSAITDPNNAGWWEVAPEHLKFTLTGASGRSVTLVADSTGGGMIETRVVDGYPLWTQGDAHVLLVFDPNPVSTLPIAAFVNAVSGLPGLVEVGASAAVVEDSDPQPSNSRGTLHWARLAEPPHPDVIRRKLPGFRVAVLDPILPVLATPARKPQLCGNKLFSEMHGYHTLQLATAIERTKVRLKQYLRFTSLKMPPILKCCP